MQTDTQTDIPTVRRTDRETRRHSGRYTDRQTDMHTDTLTDIQTDRSIHRDMYVLTSFTICTFAFPESRVFTVFAWPYVTAICSAVQLFCIIKKTKK